MSLLRKGYIYLIPVMVSLLLIIWQHWGMNFRYVVLANKDLPVFMLNDDLNGGLSIGRLSQQEQKIVLNCQTLKSSTFPFCSLMIPLASTDQRGINFSRFDTLHLELEFTSSRSDTVLVYLLNEELPETNTMGRANMYALTPRSGVASYSINLSRFNLPSWWIFSHPDEAHAGLRFDNVRHLQISTGDNTFERAVEIGFIKMELTGKWMAAKDLYLYLVAFWLISAITHAAYNIHRLHSENEQARKRARDLTQVNQFLSIEKEKYETLAKYDALTGCLNRTGLRDVLTRVLDLYIQNHIPASLILLDIDYFKRINDQYGHEEGDQVLVNLAEYIQKHIREDDYLVRWGGEEFAIVCGNTTAKGAKGLAENLRTIIATSLLSSKITVTCSFGIAELNTKDLKQWFKQADEALYSAKSNGRNCVVVAGEG